VQKCVFSAVKSRYEELFECIAVLQYLPLRCQGKRLRLVVSTPLRIRGVLIAISAESPANMTLVTQ